MDQKTFFYGIEGLENGLKIKPFTNIKDAKEWVERDFPNRFVASSGEDVIESTFSFTKEDVQHLED
jgi:hypothetical protein